MNRYYRFLTSQDNNIYYQATGGTITTITQNGRDYRVHTFLNNGQFEITQQGEVGQIEILAIAGGGGGGSYGGGGAGGYVQALLSPSTGSYSIVIGQGGAGAATNAQGAAGTNTTALGLTAIGGGGGGSGVSTAVATSGGSGGGAGSATTIGNYAGPGTGTAFQGTGGGNGIVDTTVANLGGGGGGAASTSGFDGTTTKPGDGGIGIISTIDGTATYRAGGGGGGKGTAPNNALGGLGGGGNGGGANNGAANTGGGGGASRPNPTAGNGGSGAVIIRYPVSVSKTTINVFLVAGQSHADGRNLTTEIGTPSYLTGNEIPNVKMWNGAAFENYRLGQIGRNGNGTSWNRVQSYNSWGFADVAVKNIADQLENVVVCRVTQGSSPIAPITVISSGVQVGSWNANYASIPVGTTRLLENFENRFLALKNHCELNNITMNVKGLLWHQGEADRFDSNPDSYAVNFSAIVAKIRQFTNVPTLPILYGTVADTSIGYNATIRAAHLAFAAGDGNAYCRDNNGLQFFDGIHFDAAGSRIFGEWAATTYLTNYE